MTDNFIVNYQIKGDKVIFIHNGENRGIVDKLYAIKTSQEDGLDLIQVDKKDYPICKSLDIGKYKYEQHKKHRKQKNVQLKEIRLRVVTDEQDFNLKVKHILHFLNEGHPVKVVVRSIGREVEFQNSAAKRVMSIFDAVSHVAVMGKIDFSPKSVATLLTPIVHKKKEVKTENVSEKNNLQSR